jgi:hypothetical protein
MPAADLIAELDRRMAITNTLELDHHFQSDDEAEFFTSYSS